MKKYLIGITTMFGGLGAMTIGAKTIYENNKKIINSEISKKEEMMNQVINTSKDMEELEKDIESLKNDIETSMDNIRKLNEEVYEITNDMKNLNREIFIELKKLSLFIDSKQIGINTEKAEFEISEKNTLCDLVTADEEITSENELND